MFKVNLERILARNVVIFFFFLNLEVALSYPGGDRPVRLPAFVDAPHALGGE